MKRQTKGISIQQGMHNTEYEMRIFYFITSFLLILFSGCGGGSGDSTQNVTSIPIDQQAKVNSSSAENFLAGIRLPFSGTLVEYVV